ncbi:MAG: alpha-N-arabinofuranosidase, partial [Anaerolineae bacterium]|nr:alpha-N-arabinofuranosidase [Anaerolineae bacterium]
VVMANIAQTVNVLQAMVLTADERMLVTPTGRVYEMYALHQGATSLRTTLETDAVSYGSPRGGGEVPVVAGSASLRDRALCLTLTNSHAEEGVTVRVDLLDGAAARGGRAAVLTGEIHAHNTFDAPEQVAPAPWAIDARGASFAIDLPPASVVAAQIELE